MDRIRQYLSNIIDLTDSEWAAFNSCLHRYAIPKKNNIVEEGKECDFVAFIDSGSFRFYYNNDGTEQVTAFFFENEFISDYRSFLLNRPSTHYLQALADSVIYKISREDLYRLYDEYKNFERMGRFISQGLYLSIANRLDSFLNETPEQRYQELFNRNPRFIKEIPQYMIASYLGIKPETLSRIRSRI